MTSESWQQTAILCLSCMLTLASRPWQLHVNMGISAHHFWCKGKGKTSSGFLPIAIVEDFLVRPRPPILIYFVLWGLLFSYTGISNHFSKFLFHNWDKPEQAQYQHDCIVQPCVYARWFIGLFGCPDDIYLSWRLFMVMSARWQNACMVVRFALGEHRTWTKC